MREWNVINDAVEDAKEEVRAETITGIVSNMLHDGKTVEEIVNLCHLPYDQVKKVEDNLPAIAK